MANNDNIIATDGIIEGLYDVDLWTPFDFHLISYFKSSIQLHCVSSRASLIGRALRHAIVDLLDNILKKSDDYIENDTTVIGTEHRIYHSRRYTLNLQDNDTQYIDINDTNKIEFEISSLAPTVFYQLRENIGISNINFRQSFFQYYLKNFTNSGKSGSLMYKTFDDLFILKTLRDYEARLLMQILSGYHLQLTQRSTIFNRYVGLYSIRFSTSISTIQIYIVIMVNTFTPSLKINETFDLKGSTVNRQLIGNLSIDKLHNLKDLDFIKLYPYGIRIPSNIYHRLRMVITNDVKVLKKLNVIDFSLLLGIRYLDMSEDDLMQSRPSTGVAALFHLSNFLTFMHGDNHHHHHHVLRSNSHNNLKSLSIPYLKPLEMINGNLDKKFFYHNDPIASATLPIPGIINKTNQRVYLYVAIIDMLQTYDSVKYLEQTLKKIIDHNRYRQYSIIESDEYEKRIIKFLFDVVFIDAGEDFPWARTNKSQSLFDLTNESVNDNINIKKKTHLRKHSHSNKHGNTQSNNIIKLRL